MGSKLHIHRGPVTLNSFLFVFFFTGTAEQRPTDSEDNGDIKKEKAKFS